MTKSGETRSSVGKVSQFRKHLLQDIKHPINAWAWKTKYLSEYKKQPFQQATTNGLLAENG